MRIPLLILGFFLTIQVSFSQRSTQAYFTFGLNRIGVLYEIGAKQNFAAHTLNIGLRFYEPDLVFEKNWPGLRLGYGYGLRSAKKMKLNLGVDVSTFFEIKNNVSLLLFDPKIRVEPVWNLNTFCTFSLSAAFGATYNRVWIANPSEKNKFTYLNYELATTFSYRFRRAVQP